MNLWRQDKGQKACVKAFLMPCNRVAPHLSPLKSWWRVHGLSIELGIFKNWNNDPMSLIDIIAGTPKFHENCPNHSGLGGANGFVGHCDTGWCTPANTMTPACRAIFLPNWVFQSPMSIWRWVLAPGRANGGIMVRYEKLLLDERSDLA